VLHTGEGLPTEATRAWVAYDDENLYAAFHCPHPKGATLLTKAEAHDEDVWLDDSIEVFLAPHRPGDDYYHFCVNSLGIIRDGIEDYEYLAMLGELMEKAKALPAERRPEEATLEQAEQLCRAPESISRSMTDYTSDAEVIFEQRRRIADMIERLAGVVEGG